MEPRRYGCVPGGSATCFTRLWERRYPCRRVRSWCRRDRTKRIAPARMPALPGRHDSASSARSVAVARPSTQHARASTAPQRSAASDPGSTMVIARPHLSQIVSAVHVPRPHRHPHQQPALRRLRAGVPLGSGVLGEHLRGVVPVGHHQLRGRLPRPPDRQRPLRDVRARLRRGAGVLGWRVHGVVRGGAHRLLGRLPRPGDGREQLLSLIQLSEPTRPY